MSKEGKLYLILAAIAFLALNIGLFIFSYQHAIKNFGPDKGSLDPIHFTRSGGKDAVPLGRHMRAGRNKN